MADRLLLRVVPSDRAGPAARAINHRLALDPVVVANRRPPSATGQGPDLLVAVGAALLADWGRAPAAVWARAVANLEEMQLPLAVAPEPSTPGLAAIVGPVWTTGLLATPCRLIAAASRIVGRPELSGAGRGDRPAIGIGSEAALFVAVGPQARARLPAVLAVWSSLAVDPLPPTVVLASPTGATDMAADEEPPLDIPI